MLVFLIVVNICLLALGAFEFHKADTAEGENALVHLPAAFCIGLLLILFDIGAGIYLVVNHL